MSSFRSARGLTRRSFLALPLLTPVTALASPFTSTLASTVDAAPHHFQYDWVMGTSLDLVVWTRDERCAIAAESAVLDEIRRLTGILNTRDPESEISRLGNLESESANISRELAEVFSAYRHWNERTDGVISVRPRGPQTPRNVDALGKAFVIDRAVRAAFLSSNGIEAALLNVGGDIVAMGRPCEIAVANPAAAADNAPPLTKIRLHNAAVATSGTYARGAHLLDPKTGQPAACASAASVIAPNAVTANALATALCLTDASRGLTLVEKTPGAEALRVSPEGGLLRTSGFARLELPVVLPVGRIAAPAPDWPMGYELSIALTLVDPANGGRSGFGGRGGAAIPGGRGPGGPGGRGGPGGVKRLYVAVWIENSAGKLIRVLAFWADKARYYAELSTFYTALGRNQNTLYSVARATRAAGSYTLVWDGLDDQQKPVPAGPYRIVVESSREHGVYAKQIGTIACANEPATGTLSATGNFEAVTLQYGPKPKNA